MEWPALPHEAGVMLQHLWCWSDTNTATPTRASSTSSSHTAIQMSKSMPLKNKTLQETLLGTEIKSLSFYLHKVQQTHQDKSHPYTPQETWPDSPHNAPHTHRLTDCPSALQDTVTIFPQMWPWKVNTSAECRQAQWKACIRTQILKLIIENQMEQFLSWWHTSGK